MEKIENKSLILILEKMCSYVGADYNTIDFQENAWYFKYEWSPDQEKDFINWLTEEVRFNNNLRKDITTLSYRPSKKMSLKFAEHFNMMFGWKTKITK